MVVVVVVIMASCGWLWLWLWLWLIEQQMAAVRSYVEADEAQFRLSFEQYSFVVLPFFDRFKTLDELDKVRFQLQMRELYVFTRWWPKRYSFSYFLM